MVTRDAVDLSARETQVVPRGGIVEGFKSDLHDIFARTLTVPLHFIPRYCPRGSGCILKSLQRRSRLRLAEFPAREEREAVVHERRLCAFIVRYIDIRKKLAEIRGRYNPRKLSIAFVGGPKTRRNDWERLRDASDAGSDR